MSSVTDILPEQRLKNSLILVVDDMEVNLRILSHSLAAHGYTRIITAEEGSQALQLTLEHKPDIVILDLMMPGMDGFAYLQAIRQNKAFDSMPILVQTALNDIDQKLRAFELGATDYICKPIDPGELSARTFVHLSQKIILADLKTYKIRIGEELNSARIMQQRLMPDEAQTSICERVYNMKIATYFETSFDLGGDCWGMRPLSDNRLAIYMYDFSGHGISSAMNVFRMHTIMQEFLHSGGDPGNFLAMLNRHLYPLLERNEFATMFYGIIDINANCLLYASAAAPAGVLISKADANPILLSSRGFPLGVLENATYETKYSPFMAGDLLMLYSDCLIETKDAKGDAMAEGDLQKYLKTASVEAPMNPAKAAIDMLLHAFYSHCPGPLTDDMTLAAFWRCPK